MAFTGKYPPSGGWTRLVPEKITPVPTPRPKPVGVEGAARALYEEATRPGAVHLHYQGPSPPWDKLSEKKKDRWRDQARIAELERKGERLCTGLRALIKRLELGPLATDGDLLARLRTLLEAK